jgi:glycosyltransferase involved in cell wall biosynthesis
MAFECRLAIIGTVGVPAKYGGFETLVEYLTKYIGRDLSIHVFCSAASYSDRAKTHNGAQLTYLPLKANGAQSIPYDILSILISMRSSDTLLILGVSGCLVLPIVRKLTNARILVNIDGLEWKRDKWGKSVQKFLKYSECMAVRHADVVISDNAEIQRYIREEYGRESSMIPYGADHVERIAFTDDLVRKYPFLDEPYAMSVCRIEPENNLHLIMEAFERMPDKPLVIIGNWKNSEYGQRLRDRYMSVANIHLLDPIYNQFILNQIRSNCHLYIHGHSAGGTNPSLVEAMYLGLAICSYDVDYNRATTQNEAFYFTNSSDLAATVSDNWFSDDLQTYARRMREIAEQCYTWEKVAADYKALILG